MSAYSRSLSAFEQDFYATLPPALQTLIEDAAAIDTARPDIAGRSIALIDHTSLQENTVPMQGIETPEEITALCRQACGRNGLHTAAVCVYPNQLPVTRAALDGSDVRIAVVNNFPHGTLTAEAAAQDAARSIAAGAQEIDTVLDYQAWAAGNRKLAGEKLDAVAAACHAESAALKIILKASAHDNYQSLYDAAWTAAACGADYVKTCTGKMPEPGFGNGKPDASTLLTGAVVMQAVADYNRAHGTAVGVKISGGVKTPLDCTQFHHLAATLLGDDFYKPDLFRYGASSLLKNLLPDNTPSTGAGPAGYEARREPGY